MQYKLLLYLSGTALVERPKITFSHNASIILEQNAVSFLMSFYLFIYFSNFSLSDAPECENRCPTLIDFINEFSSVFFPSKIQNQITLKSLKITNTGWRRCNGSQKPGTCCTPLKEQKQVKIMQDKTRRYKTSADAKHKKRNTKLFCALFIWS